MSHIQKQQLIAIKSQNHCEMVTESHGYQEDRRGLQGVDEGGAITAAAFLRRLEKRDKRQTDTGMHSIIKDMEGGVDVHLKNLAKQTKGFTLLEMMVVIAIVSLLAAIAIPNYISYRDNAYCTQAEGDANHISSAISSYFGVPSRMNLPRVSDLHVVTLNPDITISGDPNRVIIIKVKDRTERCPKNYQSRDERWDQSSNTYTKYIR